MPEGQVLDFTGVTKLFGDVAAVSDLSARIEPGAVTAFLGPNGAGKTTTLRILLGQLRPTSGTATIGGSAYQSLRSPIRSVGSVMEQPVFRPRRTAVKHLTALAKPAGVSASRVDEVLDLVGMSDVETLRIGGFSLGMRQRLSVASALLGDPGVLVFDEPVNGLDPEGIRWMRLLMRRLADEGRTVLISSHLLAEVQQIADSVLILSNGTLVFSGGIEDMADPEAQTVAVDSPDRGVLAELLSGAGYDFESLRSGLNVHRASAADIGTLAATSGIALSSLQQRGPSLEDVFLQFVNGTRVQSEAPTGGGPPARENLRTPSVDEAGSVDDAASVDEAGSADGMDTASYVDEADAVETAKADSFDEPGAAEANQNHPDQSHSAASGHAATAVDEAGSVDDADETPSGGETGAAGAPAQQEVPRDEAGQTAGRIPGSLLPGSSGLAALATSVRSHGTEATDAPVAPTAHSDAKTAGAKQTVPEDETAAADETADGDERAGAEDTAAADEAAEAGPADPPHTPRETVVDAGAARTSMGAAFGPAAARGAFPAGPPPVSESVPAGDDQGEPAPQRTDVDVPTEPFSYTDLAAKETPSTAEDAAAGTGAANVAEPVTAAPSGEASTDPVNDLPGSQPSLTTAVPAGPTPQRADTFSMLVEQFSGDEPSDDEDVTAGEQLPEDPN